MTDKIGNFKELRVWQLAVEFADRVYDAVEHFPKKENYILASQLLRASISVPSNIAEGSVRTRKEFAHHITIARGSLAEAETQLLIAYRRKYITTDDNQALDIMVQSLHRMLMKLLLALKA